MSNATLAFLRLVPKNALSRAVGAAARAPLPGAAHRAVVRWFVRRYGVEVDDAARPLADYESFDAFFTRTLKAGARTVAPGDDVLVSPCDGAVGASGPIDAGQLLQAKGRPYGLADFLGGAAHAADYEGGTFVTLYLAPFNYHRVHAPVDGAVTEALHVPGTLWPVNPPAVARVEDLFAVNERVLTFLDTRVGPVCVAMVGATCVGRIEMCFDDIVSNAGTDPGRRTYDPPKPLAKGEELGIFHMGSTVILLLPPGAFEAGAVLGEPGRPLRLGEPLGRLVVA